MPSVIDAITDSLQERLSNPKKPWARRLADMLVKNALTTPIDKLVPLDEAVQALRNGLHDYVRSESSLRAFNRVVDQQLEALKEANGSLRDVLPDELVDALAAWARKPWSPAARSIMKALDHEPVRELIARVLVHALVDFATAGRSDDRSHQGLAGIIGSIGRDVGAKLEARAKAFATTAVEGVLHVIARELSDPKRAKQQAALREAILSGVLAIPADDLMEELDRIDLVGVTRILRKGVGDWLETAEGEKAFDTWARALLEPTWQRKLGEVVRENGLDQVAKTHLPRIVEQRVRAFAESEEFRRFVKEVAES